MPIQSLNSQGIFKSYRDDQAMHVGEIDDYLHNFQRYTTSSGTTLASAAAQNIDDGISLSGESYSAGTAEWSAKVTANRVGMHKFELKGTFANGNIQILEFEIEVIDP